ncbi:TonB-linked SusC/RagA family outer membrane protein [Filimonas zeae]|uniref:SusC/RagA family TonB-linked outer membrane protein n=1 Tax=Filimonas zeae TaxID=1737353 RepID=A0A917J2A2_9BACT|nr:TonB-dependent receptor [Filimonas zeae]MDR6341569.1 TonB-linked SusC/RagA family outer membrane protein [Filimonas zeae]GGH75225.1 SusC/RagA family TonB-linked outer membrane protein [Filimonas zeae]
MALAQGRLVTGKVRDKNGSPIEGASISVKGSRTATAANPQGTFSINVTPGVVLEISALNFETLEVKVQNQTTLDITLVPKESLMDEVVVVAYGAAKKSSVSGSLTTVTTKQLAGATTESIDKALVGKVAGVRVSSATGDPGSSGQINIRGVGSISASTSPLYVIDGVPMKTGEDMAYYGKSSNILSSMNPDDIQSVTILKDAAAASLYGSRAANGVVVITTKKGASGKTKINYKGEYGWSKMAVNAFQMMSGPELVKYEQAALEGYYLQDEKALLPTEANYGNAAILADAKQFALDNAGSWVDDASVNTNWRDYVYRHGTSQDHQVSMSGGNEKTTFYMGIGMNKTDGIVRGSGFDRYSGRLNIDHKANKWLTVGLKEMFSYTSQNGFRDQKDQEQGIGTTSPLGILFALNPTSKVYNDDGSLNLNAGWGKVSNPIAMLNGSSAARETINSKTYRNLTNGEIGIKILPELNFRSVLGADIINVQNFEFWSPTSVNGETTKGLGSRYNFTSTTLTSSNTLRYAKTFGSHNLDVLGGFEAQKERLTNLIATAQGYSTDKLPELANGQPNQASSSTSGATLESFLGSVNYNYNNKYFLTSSIRRDGSSRLGANNRWGNFWSVGGQWKLGAEDFIRNISWINDLRVRASYGTSGTLPPDYYAQLGLYAFSGGYGSNSAINLSQANNPNLSWEKSRNMNVGVDIAFLKRVRFTAEYYKKITTDLLFQVPVSYLSGFSSSWQNLGKIQNSGFEFEVHTDNIIAKKANGFNWSTDFNLTTQKAIVKELPNGDDISYGDGNMYLHRQGLSMYSFYLPEWAGVDPESGNAQFLVSPGKSDDKTFVYGEAGRAVVGKAIPDVTGGITNTFSYKGVDVSFLVTYQFGGSLFDYPGYFSHHYGVRMGSFNLDKDIEGNYWTKPGDVAKYPRPVYANANRPDRWSSNLIKSTDNIRLREVSVGYNLPKGVAKRVFAENIRVYARSINTAMIWAKTKNIDPDVPLNGYRQVDTPPARLIFVGVNLDF